MPPDPAAERPGPLPDPRGRGASGDGAGRPPGAAAPGADPAATDPAATDPAVLDPTGLALARALAGDLAARARDTPGRRLSPEALAGRAEAAGMPVLAGAVRAAPRGPGARSRPAPRAPGRVGGLGSDDPFTGPAPGPGDPVGVGAELERLLDGAGGRARIAVHALFAQWPELVGTEVAAHSRPTGFADGTLAVSADSSTWATQLRLLGPTICAALDRRLGPGTVAAIAVTGPARPSWRHGALGLRDARGPRDTYG